MTETGNAKNANVKSYQMLISLQIAMILKLISDKDN